MEREWTHGPVVAGAFYPEDPGALRTAVEALCGDADAAELRGRLRGLIVPHAGYVYSGPVAASAYVLLDVRRDAEVVLIGPSHFERFSGVAALDATAWRTPLGLVRLTPVPGDGSVQTVNRAFRREHSLEVQLPFLQLVAAGLSVSPLLTGLVDSPAVTDALDHLVGEDTLLVVSTDLSHYLDYDSARELDAATAGAIVALDADGLHHGSACGLTGLQAAMGLAGRRGWSIQLLDLRNSGDTAGTRREVVGYGAFALVS